MRAVLFVVVVASLAATRTAMAAEEVLAWLLHRPLKEAPKGRHNARDLSAAAPSSSSSSLYDPYQDLVSHLYPYCSL